MILVVTFTMRESIATCTIVDQDAGVFVACLCQKPSTEISLSREMNGLRSADRSIPFLVQERSGRKAFCRVLQAAVSLTGDFLPSLPWNNLQLRYAKVKLKSNRLEKLVQFVTGTFLALSSTLPKTNIFAPENGWLEDDRFLLGWLLPEV